MSNEQGSTPNKRQTVGEIMASMDGSEIVIPNGKFTISSEKTGQHRTFRIHTAQNGKAKGARFVALLSGSDNQSDYKSFAVVSDDWKRIYVFNRLKSPRGAKPSQWESYACMLECMLLRQSAGYYESKGYSIQESRRCARCNRELTDPDSIRIGIGPECRKKMG